MCLNCGCGEPETRHEATDITADDVRKAAAGKPLDETLKNIRTGLDSMGRSQDRPMSAAGHGSSSGPTQR
jgi:hypothetical protein